MNLARINAKARQYRNNSDAGLWGLCLLASRVIDKARYGDGAVIEFSQVVKRTGKTIYNMAGAWVTYSALRIHFESNFNMWPQLARFRDLRAGLPYTHFLAMGELLRRFEFSPTDAISYLVDAMEQGYSADRMKKDIEAEQDGNKKPPNKEEKFDRMVGQAVYTLEEASLNAPTDELASTMAQAARSVREAIEEKPDGEPAWWTPARIVRSSALSVAKLDGLPDGLSDALLALAEAIEQAMEV